MGVAASIKPEMQVLTFKAGSCFQAVPLNAAPYPTDRSAITLSTQGTYVLPRGAGMDGARVRSPMES